MTESVLTSVARRRDRARAVGPSPGVGPAPRTLIDVFAATVARCPEQVAIDGSRERLTYVQLAARARALAEQLRALGVGRGDRVGIRVPSGTAELYVAIIGVLHAGAAYVAVDADDPPARAAAIWESSGACALIEAGLGVVVRRPPSGEAGGPTVDSDAWVIFTSGSSGQPKGVAVTHRAAAAFVDAETLLWNVVPEDRVLAGLSVAFDASCEEIWLAWRNGAALVPAPRQLVRGGAELGPWLAERAISVISTVPTIAAMWDDADLAGVRLLILGGEACPEALAWRLAPGRELWNTYGPTEATVVSTAAPLRAGEPVTIGWPLCGWEVAIVDERGEPVVLGEPGELVIAGVGLGRYLDPALDTERYTPLPALGWERAYRTGDIVSETVAGLRFIGRRDDQVKLGGRRIELGEVEAQLNAVPGVRAAAAAVQRTGAGNPVLVGYVVADLDPAQVRRAVSATLPEGVMPLVLAVESLPLSGAGKVDRKALPWPPTAEVGELTCTVAWLAERWAEQLGPLPFGIDSDFFELGGSSLAAAKLASVVRERYPAFAVADIYEHRRLGELAARLEAFASRTPEIGETPAVGWRRWGALQLAGVLLLLALTSPPWLAGIFALDRIGGARVGPQVGWAWLISIWLVFGTTAGRVAIVVLCRRLLLGRLKPGRYPRRGWLMWRLWFLDRLAEAFRSEALAGTPFAARYARLCGHRVGESARLGTLPPATALISIGAGATLESDVDAHGWWLEGEELIVGEVRIGAGARIGARALLGPGARVGRGAEIEPGSVVIGGVPASERWSGSPAQRVGTAGEGWPKDPPPGPRARRLWKLMYLGGIGLENLLPLIAAAPLVALLVLTGGLSSDHGTAVRLIVEAPLFGGGFLLDYGLLVALAVRASGRMVRPGFHPDWGATGWALWFGESLMDGARGVLFSLYSSLYIRPWLRLAGIEIGRGSEISTVVGMNRLTRFAKQSFAADDVALAGARGRGGWLHVAPIEIGSRTFLGNGAILQPDTELGADCLIGVLTTAPHRAADGTSWFGVPALELPRVPDCVDPSRTVSPSRRMMVARLAMELVRILLPASLSVALGSLIFWGVEEVGKTAGVAAMALAAVPLLLAAGICAVVLTVAAKWLVMGRYQAGEHPLWSFFVWRDEILNSLQDQFAGTWLLGLALGTPLMSVYLRAMGARVGKDVWCDTLTITEFDVVELGDRCVINRFACIETHLFHDRLMRIGPTRLGPGSTLGPSSAALPDTVIGAGARLGGRSVLMRGEELPAGTSWHGAPVRSV